MRIARAHGVARTRSQALVLAGLSISATKRAGRQA
ncbi:MAG: hypothetical protein QOG02_1279 [Gaiellales bacterium]|jgi:hypothetical protein|nr:hypothetical protein [Gaiellales bacterium]MDX6545505.1 hypothetical protein [Gaiellales bacterium]